MQPRGTQVLMGEELEKVRSVENFLRAWFVAHGYTEIRLPNIWSADTFLADDKLKNTMYLFKDKGDRDLCLVPEATAMIVELYKAGWDKSMKKPVKLCYTQRCYRYDRPQAGRYREFTQFGVEILGTPNAYELLMKDVHEFFGTANDMNIVENPERGLHYYTGRTFEIECSSLGAQKQIVGGGEYSCGAGFGAGVERMVLAYDKRSIGDMRTCYGRENE